MTARLVEAKDRDVYSTLTVPVPLGPLEVVYEATSNEEGFIWHPPRGYSFAAAGSALTVPVDHKDYRAIQRTIQEEMHGLVEEHFPGFPGPRATFFGGAAFSERRNGEHPWSEFGNGSFVLPRWTYTRDFDDSVAYLTLALGPDDATDFMQHAIILDEYDRIVGAILACAGLSTQAFSYRPEPMVSDWSLTQQPIEAWRKYIDDLQAGIAAGAFQKVVAARRAELTARAPFHIPTLLARLGAELPYTTRFAFRRKRTALIGASPELLFTKKGSHLETEALAGTIRSNGSEFPHSSRQIQSLVQSSKDQREHQFVVKQIVEVLSPLIESIDFPEKPSVRNVGQIIHLLSPISAKLASTTSVIDVLAALHPTPAVGGSPRDAAVNFILANELDARGWYAGAIGWFDVTGDAQFNVAIRSAVVDANIAHIYTGAGIVAESNGDEEYAETALKQQPMLRALGWREP